jgi:hypothetical protein
MVVGWAVLQEISANVELAGQLPYRIQVSDSGRVLALCLHAGVAYSTYYAAVREHPADLIELHYEGRVLAKASLGAR